MGYSFCVISLLSFAKSQILFPVKNMEEEFLIKSNSCTNESFNTTSDSDASLQALFSCLLGLMGITGFWLNLIVLIGVIGNAKLGTSINKLLAWICFTAMLEAVFGILAKALIIGKIL